jgi:heat shock 70kDa protein 4
MFLSALTLEIRSERSPGGTVKNTHNQNGIMSCSKMTLFQLELLEVLPRQMLMRKNVLLGSAIINMKHFIGRINIDEVVQVSKALPFLVQTLGIGVRSFIVAMEAEMHLRHPVQNVVLPIPVAFSRFQQTKIERAYTMAWVHVLRLVALLYAQQEQQIMHENTTTHSSKSQQQAIDGMRTAGSMKHASKGPFHLN